MNFGMWHEGVAAVASAIVDPLGRPVAALVLGGPRPRISRQRAFEFGRLLRDRARLVLASRSRA